MTDQLQLHFQIRLKTGERYLAEGAPGWTFDNVVTSIRNLGYWCDPSIYIAFDAIAAIVPLGTKLSEPGEELRQWQPAADVKAS